ncbi:MAG: TMEM165/GDT1 family protein [Bdellovibrionota bacterium]
MNWQLFVSIFSLIFVAEFPDKTAVATMMMAARGKPWAVFIGVALAFLVQCVVAVAFGKIISLAPERWVHLGAGFLFLAFAVSGWLSRNEEEKEEDAKIGRGSFFRTAWKAFLVIFIAEWGDITQLATASFAARYEESLAVVFFASVLGLWAATAITVLLGTRIRLLISERRLKEVSAVLFALMGLYLIYAALVPGK